MANQASLVVTMAIAVPAALLSTPARASRPSPSTASLGAVTAGSVADARQDGTIRRAFRQVLDREPTDRELRHYRRLMDEDRWNEKDIREDLADRRREDPDRVIRRAYQDILDRDPDAAGLRLYRRRMIDDDWTEKDVREALRTSPEYQQVSRKKAEDVVRRAYLSVLGRDPDAGSRTYVNRVMREDLTQRDVEQELRKSPEFSRQSAMTRARAEEIVNSAYRSVLGRDADAGSRGYVDKVLRDKWTQRDVERELRKSREYRDKQR